MCEIKEDSRANFRDGGEGWKRTETMMSSTVKESGWMTEKTGVCVTAVGGGHEVWRTNEACARAMDCVCTDAGARVIQACAAGDWWAVGKRCAPGVRGRERDE